MPSIWLVWQNGRTLPRGHSGTHASDRGFDDALVCRRVWIGVVCLAERDSSGGGSCFFLGRFEAPESPSPLVRTGSGPRVFHFLVAPVSERGLTGAVSIFPAG